MKTQLRQLQLKHIDACKSTEIANKVANDSYDAALYADYINTPDTELAGLQDAYDVACVSWNDAKDAEQSAKDDLNSYIKLVKLQDKFI